MKKTALITGVSRNIGKSICLKFLKEGYNVVGTYNTSKESAEDLLNECKNLNLFKVDFFDDAETTSFIEKMKCFHFDVIINNAGSMNLTEEGDVLHEFKNFDYLAFVKIMKCNFFAPLRICIELQNNINEGGCIINIASTDGLKATYASISYSASKAALINLSASLSNNFYPMHKVRVNSISPGWILSDEEGGMASEEGSPGSKAGTLTPIGRNGRTAEIANIAYALCQNELFLINGTNIVADGGFSNHDVIYLEEATGVSLLK